MTITLVNPLPGALRHYEDELAHVLAAAGATGIDRRSIPVEKDGRGFVRRASSYCGELARVRRADDGPAIIMWPSFGYLEVPLDLAIAPAGALVFHDARAMDDVFGMARWHGRLAAAASLFGARDTIVHSEGAASILRGLGWRRVVFLPHPMRLAQRARTPRSDGRPVCLVLGQHKPTRSLDLLEQLPKELPGFDFHLAGRGWPAVPGWEVESAFLSEAAFDERLVSADIVLLPYEHYFQSGVLVRAFELGVPAVSVRHEQPEGLFGGDWPGLVEHWDAPSVARAIEATATSAGDVVAGLRDIRMEQVVGAWARYLDHRREAARWLD